MADSLQQAETVGIIVGSIIAIATACVTVVKKIYCKGRDAQALNDELNLLKARAGKLEKDVAGLQEDITAYRKEQADKLDEIRKNQNNMQTSIAVIETILKKNFPS